jgi:hypothetical protein
LFIASAQAGRVKPCGSIGQATRKEKLASPLARGFGWSISSDGRTLALSRAEQGKGDIWLLDTAREVAKRFKIEQ